MRVIAREYISEDYWEMMKTESHHNHEIILDSQGVIRWKEDPFVKRFADGCDLNNIVAGFYGKGNGKNSEIYREFYRKLGYSLSGYWEIFYWDMNNEDAEDYKQPQIIDDSNNPLPEPPK